MNSYKITYAIPTGLRSRIVRADSKAAAMRMVQHVIIGVYLVNEVGAIIG